VPHALVGRLDGCECHVLAGPILDVVGQQWTRDFAACCGARRHDGAAFPIEENRVIDVAVAPAAQSAPFSAWALHAAAGVVRALPLGVGEAALENELKVIALLALYGA